MREVVELAQRLEMDYDFWGVPYDTMDWYPAVGELWGGYVKGSPAEDHLKRLKGLLQNDYDLFVLGAFDWKPFPIFAKYHILKQVTDGAGLVKMASGTYGSRSDSYLKRATRQKIDVPLSLAHGIPWQALRVFSSYPDTRAFLAATIDASQLGRGRIVRLRGYRVPELQLMCPGFTSAPLWRKASFQILRKDESKHPELNLPITEVKLLDYDYYCAFIIKTLLFAANRLPETTVVEDGRVRKRDRTALSELCFHIQCPESTCADLVFALRDRDNHVLSSLRKVAQHLTRGGSVVPFPIPKIPAGDYFADLWIKRNEQTVSFGSVALSVEATPAIRGVKLNRDSWKTDESIAGELTLKPGTAKLTALRLVVKQYDSLNRLVRREALGVKSSRMHLSLKPVLSPLTIYQRLEVDLLRDNEVVDRKRLGFYLSDLRPTETIRFGTWQIPFTSYVSFRLHQQYRKDGFDSTYFPYGGDHHMLAFGLAYTLKKGRAEIAARSNLWYLPAVNKFRDQACWNYNRYENGERMKAEQGVRLPCLNDPKYREGIRQRAKDLVAHFGRLSGSDFICGDEMSFAHGGRKEVELCFGPHCKEYFRGYLRRNYRTLAAVNAEYERAYRTFDEIEPIKLRAALANPKLAPLWADFRMAMEESHCGFYEMLQETVRSVKPDARFGYESSFCGFINSWDGTELWSMSRWADIISPYERLFTGRARVDFARPGVLMGLSTNGCYAPNWSREFLRMSPWDDLFRGANFTLTWWGTYADDFSIHGPFRPHVEQMRIIKRGIGRLIHGAKRNTGSIALVYSQPSVHKWTLTEGVLKSRSMLLNYEAWHALLTDTNAAFRVISDRQLSQGILEGSAFKLLILPRAQALSPEELRAIKQFVNRGGVVLADLRPGVSDEHCKPYGKGALDGVFGVVQNTKRPELKEAVVEVPFSSDGKPEPLCEALTDAALSVDRGEALGKAGDTPVMITHQYGKGRALLLNFSLDPYVQFKESISAMRIPYIRTINAPRLLQFFRHLRSELGSENEIRYVPELTDLREYRFSSGTIEYLGLIQELPESVWKFAEGTAKPLKTRRTTVHLKKEAHIHDVTAGRYHGVSDRVTAFIEPGIAKLFALMPYRVEKVAVAAPSAAQQGGELRYEVALTATARPGRHVLRLSVSGPSGTELAHYGRNLDCEAGRAAGAICLALDETPGRYLLSVRDVATGEVGQATVDVRAGEPVRPTAAQ